MGIIISMPSQDGRFLALDISIHMMMPITILASGMKNRMVHQPEYPATLHVRYRLAIGIQASQAFLVPVLLAMIYRVSASHTYTASPQNGGISPNVIQCHMFHLNSS